MKKNIIIGVLVVIVLVLLAMNFKFTKQEDQGEIACTQEAKLCPNGLAVGRTGPNCEFADCATANIDITTSTSHEDDKIEGKRLVYFRGVKQDGLSAIVTVDPIEMFGGDDGVAAAMQDTKCSKEHVVECAASLNNNFYIRNLSKNTQNLTVTLSTDVYLESATDMTKLEKVGVLELKKIATAWPKERLTNTPFWVTVKNGTVTKVEQQYIP